MQPGTWWNWLVGAALVAAAPTAGGQRGPDGVTRRRLGVEAAQGRAHDVVVPVESTFVRPVGERCQYRAHVAGTVQRPGGDGARYLPDLQIRARVDCGARAAHRIAASLRGPALSGPALAEQVAKRARVVTSVTGYACSYEPRFDFDGTQLATVALGQTCRYPARARGGGPRAR
jgi:hypothetical protein